LTGTPAVGSKRIADVYLDSAYIAKCYINEPDSDRVLASIEGAEPLVSSAWCLAEVACAFHRYTREKRLTLAECEKLVRSFLDHVDSGFWRLIPVTDALLDRVSLLVATAPPRLFLRAGDAVHLATAQSLGEAELWSNDRHLLAAASHFGLAGRSV
jgi:predicted nucleic acid-binding protein